MERKLRNHTEPSELPGHTMFHIFPQPQNPGNFQPLRLADAVYYPRGKTDESVFQPDCL